MANRLVKENQVSLDFVAVFEMLIKMGFDESQVTILDVSYVKGAILKECEKLGRTVETLKQ